MADHDDRRHAEKACQRAEEMFLVGNIRGAHRQVVAAKRLCPSLTAAAHALDAYEVHAAAAAAFNWRAVLGVSPAGAGAAKIKQADLKKQFRRRSVLVHPDRNRSAAAAGAFRLLLQAYDALSDRAEEPLLPWWMERDQPRANARYRQQHQQQARWKEPPCDFKVIYCRFCKEEFARPCGPLEEQAGMMCEDCHKWLRPPWEKKPAEATTTTNKAHTPPPPRPKPAAFPCPACETQYACSVCVGKWCLKCKACGKSSMVNVQGPELATVAKSGRAS